MRKTMHEIIDETAAFYNINNRSVQENPDPELLERYNKTELCSYNGKDGCTCAFGRLCIDPSTLNDSVSASALINGTFGEINQVPLGQEIIKEEYRGYDPLFYNEIQILHDTRKFWNETGLTDLGKESVRYLKEKFI